MRLFLAALLLIAGAAQAETCAIFGIPDGDTLKARCGEQALSIRVKALDAPETVHKSLRIAEQPYGIAARDNLRALCLGKPAELRLHGADKYRRTLADVSCGGVDVATAQIAAGLAWPYGIPKRSGLWAVAAQAKAERRGLWADAEPVAPWVWRRKGKP